MDRNEPASGYCCSKLHEGHCLNPAPVRDEEGSGTDFFKEVLAKKGKRIEVEKPIPRQNYKSLEAKVLGQEIAIFSTLRAALKVWRSLHASGGSPLPVLRRCVQA